MFTKRIIPCLDVKEGKVVKGINFVGLKEVGDPVELARQYYEQGADEIVFLDISATNEGRKTMADVAQRVERNIHTFYDRRRHFEHRRHYLAASMRSR